MKQLLSLGFCFICSCSSGQYADDSATNKNIHLLLEKFAGGTMDSSERVQITTLTYAIQNKGFGYIANNNDYERSLMEIDRAILVWSTLRDTPNEANMLKYRGYLLGKLRRFAEGKQEIEKAIHLFTLKNRMTGVAVSQFDLSLLYDMQSNTDSALHYALLALNFWKGQG